ncbi:enoyl-CoA hydratase [Celeribacter litoreus]|uniref:enoyl-CoA hydratase n=1 Tax=Celeribacter litoreus TaxID=2876714 RepID=UPI001CCFB999|nr:enoyl-CoA hydratase [Celeribacter litoreus]MCA0044256.1 enoyl-CoA hydratase [Celeribacter litoreus]
MAYKTLLIEIKDSVELIKLNRPEALNALNSELMAELADALAKADRDSKVRAIVITGSEKAFAAGADIKEMSEKCFSEVTQANLFGADADRIVATRKPVIAAVAGYALGGGCELAMMCDFILAADNAKFGQPEINLGIIPGIGGTQRLARAVGKAKAMEMILTGRFMDAEEAERAGLVSRIVPAKKLVDEALTTAAKIAEKSTISVAAAKEAVNRAQELSLTEGVLFERRSFFGLFATEDQKEGMAAFLEKREPQFRDK